MRNYRVFLAKLHQITKHRNSTIINNFNVHGILMKDHGSLIVINDVYFPIYFSSLDTFRIPGEGSGVNKKIKNK